MEKDGHSGATRTILVVEDEVIARFMLKDLLEGEHFRVLLADDGLLAVSLAIQHRPSLILMDIGLPLMDGFQAAERIRDIHLISEIPIIACTGHELCADGLFQAVIRKPFTSDDVLLAVRNTLDEATHRAPRIDGLSERRCGRN